MMDLNNKKWFAIYTKYKAEKWVVDKLQKKGIDAYVPLLSKTKRYSKRIAEYHYPLIPCYCFVRIDNQEYNRVLETEYVIGFLKFESRAISIPEKEISLLKKITGEKVILDCKPTVKHIGKKVELISGNLTGLKGEIIDVQGKKEFVVCLESIGYQLYINVNPAHLKLQENQFVLS